MKASQYLSGCHVRSLRPQTWAALRLQLFARFVVFACWFGIYAIPMVIRQIRMSLDWSRDFFDDYVFARFGFNEDFIVLLICLALSWVTFRTLVSNAVTRKVIVCTQALSDAAFALCLSLVVTVLTILSDAGLLKGTSFKPSFGSVLFASMPYNVFGGVHVSDHFEDLTQYACNPNYLLMFWNTLLLLLVCVALGELIGAVLAYLKPWMTAGIVVIGFILVGWCSSYDPHFARGQNLVQGFIRGELIYSVQTDLDGGYIWDDLVVFSAWPQILSTLLIGGVCLWLNYWLTQRREVSALQKFPVLLSRTF
ncbi:hypothetical protein KIM372_05750 [Bombiscardovia nodaiensis]|uniref:ABC transporter permease n=1 Tax=Bombiscardovia nodaiensis TaxID=2932181 RepID=A0ABM8B7J5_9BIFI|nr:hypothetical protein KIM372_05750 [Bombiscardovia nodaiensis]